MRCGAVCALFCVYLVDVIGSWGTFSIVWFVEICVQHTHQHHHFVWQMKEKGKQNTRSCSVSLYTIEIYPLSIDVHQSISITAATHLIIIAFVLYVCVRFRPLPKCQQFFLLLLLLDTRQCSCCVLPILHFFSRFCSLSFQVDVILLFFNVCYLTCAAVNIVFGRKGFAARTSFMLSTYLLSLFILVNKTYVLFNQEWTANNNRQCN